MSNHRRCLARLILTLALLVAFLIVAPNPTWAAFAINGQSQSAADGSNQPASFLDKGNSSTTLTGPSGAFSTLQALTFTATVQPLATASSAKSATLPSPAGTVTFLDNGVNIPGCVNVAILMHVATCTVTLGKGTHVITAVYSGDTYYNGSVSGNSLTLLFTFNDPAEVPEADTLLLFGGGATGVTAWLGWQWKKLKRRWK